MKALLRKDFYVLKSTLLWYALAIVIFNVSSGFGGVLITVLYSALLPSSAFAYDDRSRWGELAAMLPYSEWDIVLSRYVLGWLSIAGFGVASALARWMMSVSTLGPRSPGAALPDVVLTTSISVIFLSVCLPIYFRFDAEKSRAVRVLVIALAAGGMGAVFAVTGSAFIIAGAESGSGFGDFSVLSQLSPLWFLLVLAFAVVLTAVSIPLSRRAYRVRNGRRK